jgi:hypothetical protein
MDFFPRRAMLRGAQGKVRETHALFLDLTSLSQAQERKVEMPIIFISPTDKYVLKYLTGGM